MCDDTDAINTPQIRCLSILPEQILQSTFHAFRLNSLTDSNCKKIKSLMNRKYILETLEWGNQLEIMSTLNKKIDLEQL